MPRMIGAVDQGTIIIVSLDDGRQVPFDHRMFSHFCEGAADVLGVEPGGNLNLSALEVEYDEANESLGIVDAPT